MTDQISTRSRSLGELTYRRLREEIVTCRLAPGQAISEKQLAARLQASLAPVRQALTRLVQERLVRSVPRSGYRVTPLTPQLVRELLDAWLIIGPEITRLGIGRGSVSQRQQIAEAFEEMAAASEGTDAIAPIVRAFELLATAADNGYLQAIFDRLGADLTRSWRTLLARDPDFLLELSSEMWWRNIDTDPDPGVAAEAARRSIASARERMLHIVSKWPTVDSAEL